MKRLLLTFLFVTLLTLNYASAQSPCEAETREYPAANDCPTNHNAWTTPNTPLMDGNSGDYGDSLHNIVSLYGSFGNNEQTPGAAKNHYDYGIAQGNSIQPLDLNGNPSSGGKIVFLFLGFSNCEIEVCGGNEDIWNGPDLIGLQGQPCATGCPNPSVVVSQIPWNQVDGDPTVQQSFLYQVYHSSPLMGPHVVAFNGAAGAQTMANWDPNGYYTNHPCSIPPITNHPECVYDIVKAQLTANGFSEKQVQVVFFKNARGTPQCDLKFAYCAPGQSEPDAYTSERMLGNILRYLKCCKADGTPRYPKLRQVFLSSRIYGGYANGTDHGCTNPEPYAYEMGFTVQRLILAQIRLAAGQSITDPYSGLVDYTKAPWFDWGPYLWADGATPRSDALVWCNNQTQGPCANQRDVRWGNPQDPNQWGDLTHPSAAGAQKVANMLVTFFTKSVANGGSPFVQYWNLQ